MTARVRWLRALAAAPCAVLAEGLAFWWTRDLPVPLASLAVPLLGLACLGALLGLVSAATGSERFVARVWLALPTFVAATPLVGRWTGAGGVGAVAAAGLIWAAWPGSRRVSVLVAAAVGGALGSVWRHFLLWDYDGRETGAVALLTVGAATLLATLVVATWSRWRPAPVVASTGGALLVGIGAVAAAAAVALSGGVALPVSVSADSAAVDRPPVVIIVLDTVRADRLALYGSARDTMPRLGAFATREAVVVDRAISNGPDSLAGHASLFTGLVPARHGAHRPVTTDPDPPSFGYPLREDVPTLAETLYDAGYATLAVSGNYGPVGAASGFGLDRGFEVFRATPDGGCDFATESPWWPARGWLARRGVSRAGGCEVPYRRADAITDDAIALIDAATDRSFLLFVNYFDAHRPYWPPAGDRDRFPGFDPDLGAAALEGPEVSALIRDGTPLPARVQGHLDALYDGELAFVDRELERLLAHLRRHPRWEEMLLVITADHGEALGEHGFLGHSAWLYDVIVRVPFILRPGRSDPHEVLPGLGGRWDRPLSLVDVAPLVLRHAGVPVSDGIDGVLPEASPEPLRAWAFVSPPLAALAPRYDRELRSIERDGWKLIVDHRGGVELYDLVGDPGESVDLASRFQERVEALRELLGPPEAYRAGDQDAAPLSDEAIERLRSLGYIR